MEGGLQGGPDGCQKASWELNVCIQMAIMMVKEMEIIYVKLSGPNT